MSRTGNQIKELEDSVGELVGLVDNIIKSTQRELTRLEEKIDLFGKSVAMELKDHLEFLHKGGRTICD